MSKQTGLGDNLWVAGVDVSGDIGSVETIGGGNEPLDATAINQSAMARLGGKRDGRIEFTSYFNPATGASHDVFSALPTTDVIVSYARGQVLGNEAACMVGKQINFDPTRGEDGSLTFKGKYEANGFGMEWGRQLTAGIDSTAGPSGSGSSIDHGATTNFGLQAWLHVFSFTGTNVVFAITASSDDGVGDPFATVTGAQFTSVTSAPASQRIATAGNVSVERYLRWAQIGTFSACDFAIVVTRNLTAPVF